MAGSKLLARLLLLISSVTLVSLLALTRCGLGGLIATEHGLANGERGAPQAQVGAAGDEEYGAGPSSGIRESSAALSSANRYSNDEQQNGYLQMLQQREEENLKEVAKLTAEIKALKLQILQLKNVQQVSTGELLPNGSISSSGGVAPNSPQTPTIHDCSTFIRRQVGSAEILHGLPLNNEYELIPFNHFTFSRVYPIELGLGKRVVEKPIGYKRRDILGALNKAIETLNRNITSNMMKYTLDDFTEGIYRNEPTTGTQYELYFRTKEVNKSVSASGQHHDTHGIHGTTKLLVMRPFAPLQTIQMEAFPKQQEKELIHIILPLSGRTSTFQSFMDKYVKIALKHDKRVHLTVVYFGEDGLSEARSTMSRVIGMKNSGGNSSNLKLLALNETFSRGKLIVGFDNSDEF